MRYDTVSLRSFFTVIYLLPLYLLPLPVDPLSAVITVETPVVGVSQEARISCNITYDSQRNYGKFLWTSPLNSSMWQSTVYGYGHKIYTGILDIEFARVEYRGTFCCSAFDDNINNASQPHCDTLYVVGKCLPDLTPDSVLLCTHTVGFN